MVAVRKFQSCDLRAVLRIERQSFAKDAWPADLFREYAAACPGLFLIARSGGRIAGYSLTCAVRNGAELASVAVCARQRGKGIATALFRFTLRRLRREGVRTLWLTVRPDNAAAVRLYREWGFVRRRTVPAYYEDGSDGWRMRLEL